MVLSVLIWVMLFADSFQVQDPNCLRDNPEALDGDFNFMNEFEHRRKYKEVDISNQVALFSTRFKRGHTLYGINNDMKILTGKGISNYIKMTNKSFTLFLESCFIPESLFVNVSTRIRLCQNDFKTMLKIKSQNKDFFLKIYVKPNTGYPEEDLEVVQSVFGSKPNSTLPIGFSYSECSAYFQSLDHRKFLQRLDFVKCEISVPTNTLAERSADAAIGSCNQLRDLAVGYNISAEIICQVKYPSFDPSLEGDAGSISEYQKFWCRIVDEVKQNKVHNRIVMWSAFDEAPTDYHFANWSDPRYHSGWWRRREMNSYEPSAFVEKVEELEGGREPGSCTPLCGICTTFGECCEGTICTTDFSFQPFEDGQRQIAACASKYTKTNCAPRPRRALPSIHVSLNKTSTQDFQSDSGGSVSNAVYVSVSVSLILGLIILFGGAFALISYLRGNSNRVLTEEELRLFFQGSPSSAQGENSDDLPYRKALEVTINNFEIYEDQILGSGAFGVVVKARLGNDEVALKTTRSGVDKVFLKSLQSELKVLMYLELHANIVNLLGAYTSELMIGKLYVFMELCPLGALLEFLRDHRENFLDVEYSNDLRTYENVRQLTSRDLTQWSIQIASAMKHLAEKKVIHADIAARNVHVFSWDQMKLTDFGLSRRLYEYSNYVKTNKEPLPWRHMSVEALRDMNFSLKSDVWSFGVMLWEMFSLGCVPYPGHSMSSDFVELLLSGLRPTCPQHSHPLIYEVMSSCWTINIKSRPEIALVYSKLSSIVEQIYPNTLTTSLPHT